MVLDMLTPSADAVYEPAGILSGQPSLMHCNCQAALRTSDVHQQHEYDAERHKDLTQQCSDSLVSV